MLSHLYQNLSSLYTSTKTRLGIQETHHASRSLSRAFTHARPHLTVTSTLTHAQAMSLHNAMPSGENSSSEKAAEVEPPSTAPVEVGGPPGPPPPPNGGTTAWLQVLGAFCIMLNTWGLLNSFGVFQAEYSTGLLSSSTDSAISWIGSIQGFMMLTTAVVSGRALDAGYFYPVIVGGIFLETFGMMSEYSAPLTLY